MLSCVKSVDADTVGDKILEDLEISACGGKVHAIIAELVNIVPFHIYLE